MKLLIERARLAGLTLGVEGGRLAIEGPEEAEPLALELLAAEDEVLVALSREVAESAGPPWPAPDAVVWFSEQEPPLSVCRCCGRHEWWRLRRVSPTSAQWICGRCHPPRLPRRAIEWRIEPADGEVRGS